MLRLVAFRFTRPPHPFGHSGAWRRRGCACLSECESSVLDSWPAKAFNWKSSNAESSDADCQNSHRVNDLLAYGLDDNNLHPPTGLQEGHRDTAYWASRSKVLKISDTCTRPVAERQNIHERVGRLKSREHVHGKRCCIS